MSVRVLGICGSMRVPSATRYAVEIALQGAGQAGAVTEFIDIADAGLPFCDGRDDENTYPEPVQRFRAMIQNAQGIILGTPEYHNSMTGALKNALDLCTVQDFEHKMVGLIGIAGGAIGAINAINHLRTVMRSVGAWVVPHQVSISESDQRIVDSNLDPVMYGRLIKLGSDVTKFSKLMAAGIIDPRGMEEV
jgi:NAD(P)H-dependent FMN reductase